MNEVQHAQIVTRFKIVLNADAIAAVGMSILRHRFDDCDPRYHNGTAGLLRGTVLTLFQLA